MVLTIQCVPAPDNVPLAPCGVHAGVALMPVVVQTDLFGPLNYDEAGEFFGWAAGFVLFCFLIGVAGGAVIGIFQRG